MSQFMDINLNVATPALDKLAGKLANLSPVYRMIAGTMADKVEDNFEQEGRPAWMDLADSTIERRLKRGTWPGKKLQEGGGMRFCIKAIKKKAVGKVDSQGVARRQKQGTTGYACACTGYALPHKASTRLED